jgi:hypothetical protein
MRQGGWLAGGELDDGFEDEYRAFTKFGAGADGIDVGRAAGQVAARLRGNQVGDFVDPLRRPDDGVGELKNNRRKSIGNSTSEIS